MEGFRVTGSFFHLVKVHFLAVPQYEISKTMACLFLKVVKNKLKLTIN